VRYIVCCDEPRSGEEAIFELEKACEGFHTDHVA
jgi:hypothetical protein